MPKALDITNQKFGNLTAIKKVASKSGKTYWLCKCDCGNEKEVQTAHLVNGSIKSCGCGKFQSIKKQCEICGTEFETKANGASRKYCYECSPSYPKGGSRAETIKSLRKAMKREAVKRLGGKCCKCGYNQYIGALQFHHLNPAEKEFNLAANGNTHSWKEFWTEVSKCILVCSNCHAEIHKVDS